MNLETASPRLRRLWEQVPAEEVAALAAFRAEHPERSLEIDGVDWHYFDVGQSERTLLLLTGIVSLSELAWQGILRHAAMGYRVIAPSYPPLRSMAELADGVATLLDRLGIEKADINGGSYGGFVAQVLMRRHPEKVGRLVLSHTVSPRPERAPLSRRNLPLLRALPPAAVRALFGLRMGHLMPQGPEGRLFVAHASQLAEERLSKQHVIAIIERLHDYDTTCCFSPEDIAGRSDPILIALSEDDPATPPAAREDLIRLYPGAEVELYRGAGHTVAITKPDLYYGRLVRFFNGQTP